jgi:hypothetical protein
LVHSIIVVVVVVNQLLIELSLNFHKPKRLGMNWDECYAEKGYKQ